MCLDFFNSFLLVNFYVNIVNIKNVNAILYFDKRERLKR